MDRLKAVGEARHQKRTWDGVRETWEIDVDRNGSVAEHKNYHVHSEGSRRNRNEEHHSSFEHDKVNYLLTKHQCFQQYCFVCHSS